MFGMSGAQDVEQFRAKNKPVLLIQIFTHMAFNGFKKLQYSVR